MKNLLMTSGLFFLLLFSLNSNGQGFYIDAGAAYGFDAVSQNIDNNYTFSSSYTFSGGNSSETSEIITGSFGKGISFGASFGYMFSKHLGGELGLSYLSGASIKSTSSDNFYSNYGGGIYSGTIKSSTIFSANMIRIIPAIKIQGGDGNIIPYMKLGFVIGLNPSIEITANSNEHEVNQSIVSDTVLTKTIKLSKGYSLGFMAALGADFKLNDALSIYGEVGIIGQSYAPTHGEITSSTKNGIDVLGKMTTNQKEVEFVDKYSHSSSTGSSTNQGVPDQTLKTYLPFSSWGLNIGVHYIFGSK